MCGEGRRKLSSVDWDEGRGDTGRQASRKKKVDRAPGEEGRECGWNVWKKLEGEILRVRTNEDGTWGRTWDGKGR